MKIVIDSALSMAVPAAGIGWLALDKPAGITVHNAPGRDVRTLCSAFIRKDPAAAQIGLDPDFGLHPVHRLDRETSGLILLATVPETFRFFAKQFESRQVRKLYLAILHGRLAAPSEEDSWGSWHWPLAASAGGRRRPEGSGPLQPAETRYRLLDHSAHYSLVEIEPRTGRKHQIRRHAKLAGHPVCGDARYGSRRALDFLKSNFGFNRLALHAHSLTLHLPGAAAPQTIRSAGQPDALQDLFEGDR